MCISVFGACSEKDSNAEISSIDDLENNLSEENNSQISDSDVGVSLEDVYDASVTPPNSLLDKSLAKPSDKKEKIADSYSLKELTDYFDGIYTNLFKAREFSEKYSFENIECNQHLQRDCQKNSDDTGHNWSTDLKKHISQTIKDRKDAIERGDTSFDKVYADKFYQKVNEYLAEGRKENEADPDNYGASFERTLLKRITKYLRNYFLWVEDFSLPTTNNLSERGLRGIKSHMKISGQFESETVADNYALIVVLQIR